MSVCVWGGGGACVCMCLCLCVCVHACAHACLPMCLYVCLSMHDCDYVCVCMSVCGGGGGVRAYMWVCVCVGGGGLCVCMSVRLFVYHLARLWQVISPNVLVRSLQHLEHCRPRLFRAIVKLSKTTLISVAYTVFRLDVFSRSRFSPPTLDVVSSAHVQSQWMAVSHRLARSWAEESETEWLLAFNRLSVKSRFVAWQRGFPRKFAYCVSVS